MTMDEKMNKLNELKPKFDALVKQYDAKNKGNYFHHDYIVGYDWPKRPPREETIKEIGNWRGPCGNWTLEQAIEDSERRVCAIVNDADYNNGGDEIIRKGASIILQGLEFYEDEILQKGACLKNEEADGE